MRQPAEDTHFSRLIMSVPQSIQDQEIRTSLKTLIRGLTQGNRSKEYEGYKALYKIGAPAIPQIRDAIFRELSVGR
jgi:hypothetical protein